MLLATSPAATDRHPPAFGAVSAMASRGELAYRLDTRHAGTRDVQIRWELCGAEGAPLLVVAGGISAHRHVIAHAADLAAGWWQAQAGLFGRHRLLAIDWIGDGDGFDAPIDSADQADAIAAVMAALGLPAARAFVGASYGAMVGLQFAARHPGRLHSLVAISGGHRPHPWASALRSVQRKVIELGGDADPASGVALARQLAMLSYRTPQEFAERFDAPVVLRDGVAACAADDYLAHCGKKGSARFDARSYLRLSESIDLHRIEPETVRVPLGVIAVEGDLLVPPDLLAELAVRAPDAWLQTLSSRYGHDAFLKETTAISAALTAALEA